MNGIMENKILTIAIPTYNRKSELKACLDHVCSQLNKDVIVVVRDNCSNNYDFPSFIKTYVDNFGIVAVQNKINIGGDANIAKLYEECQTKWLWVIGDDDVPTNDAISTVLDVLYNNQDALFIKFNSKYVGTTNGIEGFCQAMQVKYQFGNTYFLSETIHNIELGRNDIYWHYRYLSLYIGQILRDIYHLLSTKDVQCLFVDTKILREQGKEISWSQMDLAIRNLWLFDLFYDQKCLFENNIFKEIATSTINAIHKSNLNKKKRWYFYKQVILKYGLFNTMIYCKRTFVHALVRELCGQSLANWIKQVV